MTALSDLAIQERNRVTNRVKGSYPGGDMTVAPMLGESPVADCDFCDDTGFYIPNLQPNQPGFGRAVNCPNCVGMGLEPSELLKRSGVPRMDLGYTFDFFLTYPSKAQTAEMVKSMTGIGHGFIYLHGPYGMGKSGMLKASVNETCKAGRRGIYAEMGEVLRYERSKFGKDADDMNQEAAAEEKKRMSRLRMCHTLAIDELDKITDTQWVREQVFSLLNTRYSKRESHLTIIASNTTVDRLPTHMDWLKSRFSDALVFEVSGKHLRGLA